MSSRSKRPGGGSGRSSGNTSANTSGNNADAQGTSSSVGGVIGGSIGGTFGGMPVIASPAKVKTPRSSGKRSAAKKSIVERNVEIEKEKKPGIVQHLLIAKKAFKSCSFKAKKAIIIKITKSGKELENLSGKDQKSKSSKKILLYIGKIPF